MEREIFIGNPLRGLPKGLVRGFIFGCIILLTALALGMDEDKFIPLLVIIVTLGGIISLISGIGKKLEADENGIYLKKKEYLFAENEMFMQVHTHYYTFFPITERCIHITAKDGKRKVKFSFLSSKDAGRLAKIIEDGMRNKHRTVYDGLNDAAVQSFTVSAAELTERIDKRCRLLTKTMFWFLTVLFSWILISMVIDDDLGEHWLMFLLFMALNVLILGGTDLFICRKFKKSARNIPCEIVLCGGTMYIDGMSYGGSEVTRVVMTPERGSGTGDMRKLVIREANGDTALYSFGLRSDRDGFPMYGELVEAVKVNFGDRFAYDMN